MKTKTKTTLVLWLLMLGSATVAQKLSAQTTQGSPAPPAFDCSNPAPQPIGDHATMQIVAAHSPPYAEPPNVSGFDKACFPSLPCVVFSLPSGQRGLVYIMGSPTVLEGHPLEYAQLDRMRDAAYAIIVRCQDKLTKPK